jgi:uncharacterized protein (UPF0332 family)
MMSEQLDLLRQASQSLQAAQLLRNQGYHGFAASRAYYTMFYVAEAFLLGKGLAFSKHRGVHAAFGQHFCKPAIVPPEFSRYLSVGMETRHLADYGHCGRVTPEKCDEVIRHAQAFLEVAKRVIGPFSAQDEVASES